MNLKDKEKTAIDFLIKHGISLMQEEKDITEFCDKIAKQALPMLADIPHIENRVKAAVLLGFAGNVMFDRIIEEMEEELSEVNILNDVLSGKVKSYCYKITFKSGKEARIMTNKLIGEDEVVEHLKNQDELAGEEVKKVELCEDKEHKKIAKILQNIIK